MDVLASPNIINYLVILIANYKTKHHVTQPKHPPQVALLQNFKKTAHAHSCFATDLKTVFKSTELLNAFKLFLNREEASKYLVFCLDVGK